MTLTVASGDAHHSALPQITAYNSRIEGCRMGEGLFQPMHLLVIFFIALLIFGPRKQPELGKGIGEGIRALKEGLRNTATSNPEEKQSANAKPGTPVQKS